MKKIFSLFLALLLLIGALAGCQKSVDPMAKSGFRKLTVDAKGRVSAAVSLDLRTVQAHTDEKVRLYELLPGESVTSAMAREPLDEARVSQSPEFRFPLRDGDRTRLYSSYAVVFEDGIALTSDGYYIQNPQILAADTRQFPWSTSPKGLYADNVDDALSLGAMHVLYEVALSELITGTESVTLNGVSCTVSADTLSRLDAQIGQADTLGMQVSLSLHVDTSIATDAYAALIDHLVSRSVKDGRGALTAVFLHSLDVTQLSSLCRLTDLALRSRVADGRVYVAPVAASLDDAKIFFSTLQAQLLTGGEMPWGAAVIPQCEEPVETDEPHTLTLAELSALSEFLLNTADGAPSFFAVCGLSIPASDADRQAAAYAYAYRQAIQSKADLIFYRDHIDDLSGLRAANGDARRILSIFSSIDTGLSAADRRLCADQLGDKWNPDTEDLVSVKTVSGVANVGTAGLEESTLFDFTTGECYGFAGIGVSEAPKSHHSAAWNAPVLYTWVDPLYGNGGICKRFDNATQLENVSSMSVSLLCQSPDAETCSAKLTLEGTTSNGERISFMSDVTLQNGTWQTATFQIGSFIADADLSSPVVMTLTTSADTAAEEEYVLWVKSIDVRRTDAGIGAYLPIAVTVGCLAVGFLAVFLIYRKSKYRRA